MEPGIWIAPHTRQLFLISKAVCRRFFLKCCSLGHPQGYHVLSSGIQHSTLHFFTFDLIHWREMFSYENGTARKRLIATCHGKWGEIQGGSVRVEWMELFSRNPVLIGENFLWRGNVLVRDGTAGKGPSAMRHGKWGETRGDLFMWSRRDCFLTIAFV